MSTRSIKHATALLALAAGVTLAACDTGRVESPEPAPDAHQAGVSPEVEKQLDQVRRATVRFHRFEAAERAGYGTRITECFQDATAGGMGFHYGNTGLFDAVAEVARPEVLLYEPRPNGSFKLVGVEYIIPRPVWTSPNPPTLFGRPFHYNSTFDIWALHAWVWRDNPSGVFTDWNPEVSCWFADRVR